MNTVRPFAARRALLIVWIATLSLAAYGTLAHAQAVKVALSGDQEIPPVTTAASGTGTFSVADDKSVSGQVTVSGMTVAVAHVHEGAPGAIGPIIIPLTKTSDNVWTVPAGTKLTDTQYASFKAGNLYYNMHSAAHKSGEIRGQIKP